MDLAQPWAPSDPGSRSPSKNIFAHASLSSKKMIARVSPLRLPWFDTNHATGDRAPFLPSDRALVSSSAPLCLVALLQPFELGELSSTMFLCHFCKFW
jgi:hypothetical protein